MVRNLLCFFHSKGAHLPVNFIQSCLNKKSKRIIIICWFPFYSLRGDTQSFKFLKLGSDLSLCWADGLQISPSLKLPGLKAPAEFSGNCYVSLHLQLGRQTPESTVEDGEVWLFVCWFVSEMSLKAGHLSPLIPRAGAKAHWLWEKVFVCILCLLSSQPVLHCCNSTRISWSRLIPCSSARNFPVREDLTQLHKTC